VLSLLLIFSHAFAEEEAAVPADHNDDVQSDAAASALMVDTDDALVGECDPAVTQKYMETIEKLQVQQAQQLADAHALCETETQLKLQAAQASVEEYQSLLASETESLQRTHAEKMEEAARKAEERVGSVQQELQQSHEKQRELQGRLERTREQLQATEEQLVSSTTDLSNLQAELEQMEKELSELENQYINWRVIQRQYQDLKDSVQTFYDGTLHPMYVTSKQTCIAACGQAESMYHKLRTSLAPVWRGLGGLLHQLAEKSKLAWQQLVTLMHPHVLAARQVLGETTGPHIAAFNGKLQSIKADATTSLQASPIYPHILKCVDGLEQFQTYITNGCFQVAKATETFLQQHEGPERIVSAFSFVKNHPAQFVEYLEGGIATLILILIVHSLVGGSGAGILGSTPIKKKKHFNGTYLNDVSPPKKKRV
jgi:phage-related tail protein